jgi:flagellar hook-associated protein 2
MATTATGSATGSATGGVIQSLGVGSGLDIQSLVTQLVAADRAPLDARISRQATKIATQFTALGTLKGALSTFQAALSPLTSGSQFLIKSATSADPTIYTATTGSAAVSGNYDIEVRQLAQPEQLISTNFTGGAAAVLGAGQLQVTLGSSSFGVAISSGNATLADVRDAINSAAGNPGVKATLVYGQTGAQLVLASASSGASNAITVSVSGAGGALANLSYTGSGDAHYTETQQARDSIVFVSGVEHHSASNVVDGAIDGVTLSLKTAKPNTTISLAVTDDQATVTANIQKLVAAYNTVLKQFQTLGKYDAASKTGGPMLGDYLLKDAQFSLSRGFTDRVAGISGNYNSLAAAGVTTAADGTLNVDASKLQAALTADPGSIAKLFAGPNGISTRLNSKLTSLLSSNGTIAVRNLNLASAQLDVTRQQTNVNNQMAQVQARYLKQFNALDSLMSQMQSTSNYLTQQLANSASIGNGSSTKSG